MWYDNYVLVEKSCKADVDRGKSVEAEWKQGENSGRKWNQKGQG